jgi:hypothetical protein
MVFMKRAGISFASILALALLSVAHPQDVETVADVRCVVVGMQMSRSFDATQHASGTMVVMYYLGRLDRVVPGPNLEALIVNEASQMSTAGFQTEAARCGKLLIDKGQLLERIGNNPTLRSQKQENKKPNPSQ